MGTVSTAQEVALICHNFRAFVPPLLLDQFGNYAAQLCLSFYSPHSDFLFDAMVDRCWEIASGRFGARSMRTCLEAPSASQLQQKRVAIAIILNSVLLATNPNGALLLTWLLDTSGFNGRYRLLATRLLPHLAQLCPHKVASTTILKIVNQKADPASSRHVVDAILNSPEDTMLQEILGEQVHGSSFMHKLLSSPHLDNATREAGAAKVKAILETLQPHHSPAYAKLCHEVGLPAPSFPNSAPLQVPPHGTKQHQPQHFVHTPQQRGMPGANGYPFPYTQHQQQQGGHHNNLPSHPMSPPFAFPAFGSPLSPPARLMPSANSHGPMYAQRQPSPLHGYDQQHMMQGHSPGRPDGFSGSQGAVPPAHPRASPSGSSPRNAPLMPGLGHHTGPLPNAYVEHYLQNVAALQMSGFNSVGGFSPHQVGMVQPPYHAGNMSSSPPYGRMGGFSGGPPAGPK